jgi:hypothetical protein
MLGSRSIRTTARQHGISSTASSRISLKAVSARSAKSLTPSRRSPRAVVSRRPGALRKCCAVWKKLPWSRNENSARCRTGLDQEVRRIPGPRGRPRRLLIVNLGRDLLLGPAPEPLLAPFHSPFSMSLRSSVKRDGAAPLVFHHAQSMLWSSLGDRRGPRCGPERNCYGRRKYGS